MSLVVAQVALERKSNLAEDRTVNTFAFITPTVGAPSSADLTAIADSLEDFYKGVTGGNSVLSTFLNERIQQNGHSIKLYDINTPEPRPPVLSRIWNLATAPAGLPLPGEVALCLSFRAAGQAGVPAGRNRGRIYFGPLTTGSVSSSVSLSDVFPNQSLINSLVEAGKRLMDNSAHQWGIFSRTRGIIVPIVEVSVDNAFDTQRRRGGKPTVKTIRTPSGV